MLYVGLYEPSGVVLGKVIVQHYCTNSAKTLIVINSFKPISKKEDEVLNLIVIFYLKNYYTLADPAMFFQTNISS